MQKKTRPIAPHLQIYKPQITSILSILHRFTGVFLTFGLFILVWFLYALAEGGEVFAQWSICMHSYAGALIFMGITFSLAYHFCNGIRHLFWDIGKGYDLKNVTISGVAVVIISLLLTIGLCFYVVSTHNIWNIPTLY